MRFNFKAKTKTGEIKTGTIDATSYDVAVNALQGKELFPIEVTAEVEKSELTKAVLKYYDRVNAKELVMFFRQLAVLIEARVPLVSSLSAINDQTINKYFHRILSEMINDVEDGLPFSEAMEKHPDVFSMLSINLIKAGEASGNLKGSVEYVADNIEKNYMLSSRIKSAMTYPCIILIVFFVIGFLMVSFILPRLTEVIKELNANIPWYTQMIISVGDFMSVYWWAVAIIILGFIGGLIYYLKTPGGKREWDQVKIKLPIFGLLYRNIYISRFAENLAVLLAGGIPIIRALTITSAVINNIVYEEIILETAEKVRVGGNISDVFGQSPLIPPVVSQMVRIGEESGQLDAILRHLAKFYDQETDMMTKNMTSLIEPVLIIIIGIAVGFMAFSILMPIYNVAQQIK